MKRVCVFCGSRPGARPGYAQATVEFADALVGAGLGLVYGGASVGLMGTLATRVLEGGGEVVGVIPRSLVDREIAYQGLTRLFVAESMHERKARMAELADGFVALPGGLGTFDELLEVATWAQLGLHHKPIGLLNVEGYFSPLLDFLQRCASEGFIPGEQVAGLLHGDEPVELLARMGA